MEGVIHVADTSAFWDSWHGKILIFFASLSPLGLVAFSLAMTQVNFLLPFILCFSLSLSLFLRVFFFFWWGGWWVVMCRSYIRSSSLYQRWSDSLNCFSYFWFELLSWWICRSCCWWGLLTFTLDIFLLSCSNEHNLVCEEECRSSLTCFLITIFSSICFFWLCDSLCNALMVENACLGKLWPIGMHYLCSKSK